MRSWSSYGRGTAGRRFLWKGMSRKRCTRRWRRPLDAAVEAIKKIQIEGAQECGEERHGGRAGAVADDCAEVSEGMDGAESD